MKLKHLFDLYTPFNTKEDIDNFFVYLIGRNTTMTEEIKEKLLNSCDETIKFYMQDKIVSYVKNYKVHPGKPKPKGQTGKKIKHQYHQGTIIEGNTQIHWQQRVMSTDSQIGNYEKEEKY